jgi:hypothetical protein
LQPASSAARVAVTRALLHRAPSTSERSGSLSLAASCSLSDTLRHTPLTVSLCSCLFSTIRQVATRRMMALDPEQLTVRDQHSVQRRSLCTVMRGEREAVATPPMSELGGVDNTHRAARSQHSLSSLCGTVRSAKATIMAGCAQRHGASAAHRREHRNE